MARSSQYWLVVLMVLLAAAASASVVGADEAVPTTVAEKIEATKEFTRAQAAEAGVSVKTWKEWAFKQAGQWSGKGQEAAGGASESAKGYANKGSENVQTSTGQAQKYASDVYNKWSSWAKDTAGKYKPAKNPAAEAVNYINTKTSKDEEL